ncbi:MAG: hypothetical protein QOI63_1269 [Thermoplasmata archaeon]|nr:hypothetical protein [Thermoplasmata archaeon]
MPVAAFATVAAHSAGLLAALSLSFLFWILVAYSALRFVRFGLCSVCGAVVSVWAANLVFHFLPDWMGLLLMGQSVVGGATLGRDFLFAERILALAPHDRRPLVAQAQLVWFGLILVGTVGLGTFWLRFGQRPGMPLAAALAATGILAAVLAGAFVFWLLAMLAAERVLGWSACQVCATVSSVWVANLVLGFLPTWVTVFLMGQSTAGLAALGRDWAAARFGINALPDGRRRVAKQLAYFGFILAGTFAAVLLAQLALPVA